MFSLSSRGLTAACTLLLAAAALSGCSDERLSPHSVVDAGTEHHSDSELDRWIRDSITLPYGIEVVYRQENHAGATTDRIYPPRLEQVRPALEAFRHLCLESFAAEGLDRPNLLLGRAPLRLYLYGGTFRDENGMARLYLPTAGSTAEMALFNLNAFAPDDEGQVYALARSGLHQLCKHLMAVMPYDRDTFSRISAQRYTHSTASLVAPWSYTTTPQQQFGLDSWANKRGCLTIHGMISAEDDFAEMLSATLCATPAQVQAALTEAATPDTDIDPEVNARYAEEAKQAYRELTAKQQFVDTYVRQTWNLDLRRLQVRTVRRLNSFVQQQRSHD